MKQGDVYWYDFRAPDKRRPVLILTRNSAIAYLTNVTVGQITTTIRNAPSEVILHQSTVTDEKATTYLTHQLVLSPRSGRQRKAWGVSPRSFTTMAIEPAQRVIARAQHSSK